MNISDIKKQTSLSLEGNILTAILATLFYTLINILISLLSVKLKANFSNLFIGIIPILLSFAFMPFSYGLIISLVKLSKGENIHFTDFINTAILNYFKVLKLVLLLFVKLLIPIIILLGGFVLYINFTANPAIIVLSYLIILCSLIWLISIALNYIFFFFINYETPEKKCSEILKESKDLIKGNKFKVILLVASYFIWFVLFIIAEKVCAKFVSDQTLKIINQVLVAVITPYITVSQFIFYDSLKNEKIQK